MNRPPEQSPGGGYAGRGTALALSRRTALAPEMGGDFAAADRLDQTLHLRDLVRIFLKRKWTILIIFLVSALFSVVTTYLAPPVYRATTTIQIERMSPRVLDYKDVTPMETSDDNNDFYYTNYELLKSRTLAERAVEDMGLRKASSAATADAASKPATSADELTAGSMLQDLFNRMRRGPAPVELDPK